MKPIKWTKADAKRAKKMGWCFTCLNRIEKWPNDPRFKSDDEAIEWVIYHSSTLDWHGPISEWTDSYKTCRKALFLCARG